MKRRPAWLAGSLLLALLGGCAQLRDGPRPQSDFNAFKVDPTVHNIAVVEGVIVLQQDPMVFITGKDQKDVLIVWNLDPKPSDKGNYTFSDGKQGRLPGIQFGETKDQIHSCKVADDGKSYSCKNKVDAKGKFPYTIHLLLNGNRVEPVDPTVNNM